MSDLIVIAYDDEYKADEVLSKLARMQKEHLVDLEDACVVVRNQDGKVKLRQAQNLIAAGALSGSFWGLLVGVLFANPLVGILVGAGAGAASGALSDIGIDDDFMRGLGSSIEPGTSALFVLVRKATPDKVLPEIQEFGGEVLKTSLSDEDEKRLQDALDRQG
jgi:uncharacterized membrane protein